MKKLLVLVAIVALPTGLCLAGEAAPPQAQSPGTLPALSDCASPVDAATLEADRLMVTELDPIITPKLPPCPSTYGCGGYNVVCQATNCHTTDLGYSACQGGGYVVSCTKGQTIHVTNCGCQELFRARCCNQFPACLCAGCNSGSQSVSCQ